MAVIRNIVEVLAEPASQTIRLVTDTGREIDVKVGLCKLALDVANSLVYLYEASQSELAVGVQVYEPQYYVLNFNNITDPIAPNATTLRNTILGYLADAGGSGGATEANQVIQIEQLVQDTGEPSVFKKANDKSVFQNAANDNSIYDQMSDSATFGTLLNFLNSTRLNTYYGGQISFRNIYVFHENFSEATLQDLTDAMRVWQNLPANQQYTVIDRWINDAGTEGSLMYTTAAFI